MPKERYERWNPSRTSLDIVHHANRIIIDFQAQGYSLTLRQLYYQFVSKALIPNSDRSYKNLGGTIDRARKAGLIDWDAIEDRTRNVHTHGHVDGPEDVIRTTEYAFYQDLWLDQPVRIEVWVEKEALADVIARPANRWNCNWFCCRGYVSQSEQWRAARRIHGHIQGGQRVIILHLGDHDPSGIDMTRDIKDRITHFICVDEQGYDPDPRGHVAVRADRVLRRTVQRDARQLQPVRTRRRISRRPVRGATHRTQLGSDPAVQPATEPGEADRFPIDGLRREVRFAVMGVGRVDADGDQRSDRSRDHGRGRHRQVQRRPTARRRRPRVTAPARRDAVGGHRRVAVDAMKGSN